MQCNVGDLGEVYVVVVEPWSGAAAGGDLEDGRSQWDAVWMGGL